MTAGGRFVLVLMGALVMYGGGWLIVQAPLMDWVSAVLTPVGVLLFWFGITWVARAGRLP